MENTETRKVVVLARGLGTRMREDAPESGMTDEQRAEFRQCTTRLPRWSIAIRYSTMNTEARSKMGRLVKLQQMRWEHISGLCWPITAYWWWRTEFVRRIFEPSRWSGVPAWHGV